MGLAEDAGAADARRRHGERDLIPPLALLGMEWERVRTRRALLRAHLGAIDDEVRYQRELVAAIAAHLALVAEVRTHWRARCAHYRRLRL